MTSECVYVTSIIRFCRADDVWPKFPWRSFTLIILVKRFFFSPLVLALQGELVSFADYALLTVLLPLGKASKFESTATFAQCHINSEDVNKWINPHHDENSTWIFERKSGQPGFGDSQSFFGIYQARIQGDNFTVQKFCIFLAYFKKKVSSYLLKMVKVFFCVKSSSLQNLDMCKEPLSLIWPHFQFPQFFHVSFSLEFLGD